MHTIRITSTGAVHVDGELVWLTPDIPLRVPDSPIYRTIIIAVRACMLAGIEVGATVRVIGTTSRDGVYTLVRGALSRERAIALGAVRQGVQDFHLSRVQAEVPAA